MRVCSGPINEGREESRQLGDQFTADLKGMLNADQSAMWPAYERKLFRLKYLKNGQLPAENLDLLTDVRDLELDVVTAENVHRLRTRVVAQGANIPCTAEAEKRLHAQGVLCLPDFIANAGGVICASVE